MLLQPRVVECKFTFADLQRLMRLMKNECLNSTKNYRPGNKVLATMREVKNYRKRAN